MVAIAVAVVLALAIAARYLIHGTEIQREEARVTVKPQAPPDLEKLRTKFQSGLDAIHRSDPDTAIREFSSFTFGPRAVEDYRLYYLANGYQLAGKPLLARRTLGELWSRDPRLAYRDDAALNLAAMNAAAGDALQSAEVYERLAVRSDNPAIAAASRWQEIEQRLAAGDVAGALRAARRIVIASPRSAQVGSAIAVLRSFWSLPPDAPLHLTPAERLERAVCLLRDGDAQNALDELTAVEPYAPESLKTPIVLNRGLALYQLRRFDDAIHTFEPLTSGPYKFAIPALYHLANSYRVLSAAINPIVNKTIVEKKRAGNVKVRVGKGKKAKTVSRPKIVTTRRTVQLVDLAKKAKKDEYDRLATERLKDLLLLPLATPVRLEVLNTLIGLAEAKNQDDYEQQLVKEVIRIDPTSDPGLQHFWDKAWAAYERGDLATAKPLFRFIADTYTNANVKRQSDYWYARSVERQGQKEEAHVTYQRLANAPYLDLYAMNAVGRGATHQENHTNPLKKGGPDWRDIGEKVIPPELRLAYELTGLSDFRDAHAEIVKNMNAENDRYVQALLADFYNSEGAAVLMQRAVRRAFPQVATADQDSMPAHFLQMYYPVKFESAIREYSARNGLDPYLVMGLILQESSFLANARSAVGATGLMQLMPSTGKELAQKLHVPFGQARLENPEVNVELGTAHLKMLVNMFGGNPLLAVAAYNAGQGNVLKWKRSAPGKPLDEFLESIPFAETRNYVKRVTMLRSTYTRIAP
ncbi:MAG TPA: lytic transglycosylase domain-containing protein [Thermoanaerobaculia bacterium]